MSIAVGVVVPLLSAALAALIAWIVATQQRQGAREQWVLDKRYEVYERFAAGALGVLARVHAGVSGVEETERLVRDGEARGALITSLAMLDLIAPAKIREQEQQVVGLVWAVLQDRQEAYALWTSVEQLMALLREDLVPESMR